MEGKYIICDLAVEAPVLEADIIVHAAAATPSAGQDFNCYYKNNVVATQNILKYAMLHNIKRIIYMGAVSSYGEVDNILGADSPHNNPDHYGLTKYMGELLVKNSVIPHDILILPGVAGKGCRKNWVVESARELSENRKLIYYNGHSMFNNVLEIGDLCTFVGQILEERQKGNETYLLGAGGLMKVEDVIRFMKKRLLSDSELCEKAEGHKSFYLDISRALKAGFSPKSIETILEEICNEIWKEREGMV